MTAALKLVRASALREPHDSAFALDPPERWQRYQRSKQVLVDLNLPPAEYERRLLALAEDLEV